MLVERLSPRWSSTGLTPFLGRPGSIFTNPTLIHQRQKISQHHWLALASPSPSKRFLGLVDFCLKDDDMMSLPQVVALRFFRGVASASSIANKWVCLVFGKYRVISIKFGLNYKSKSQNFFSSQKEYDLENICASDYDRWDIYVSVRTRGYIFHRKTPLFWDFKRMDPKKGYNVENTSMLIEPVLGNEILVPDKCLEPRLGTKSGLYAGAPDFLLELLQQSLSFASSMGIVIQEDDNITQHARAFASDGFTMAQ
ncbi:hypothetical protein AVEN_78165-1 [Araneus ventricosus]|uniref:Uncharacterized protein n=1 Tax=Araneus ventricosus TaxID=182803 RepID=A0A4Y2KNF4_ARAVE|nr:hypothetical protein AVEN_78165-1 [Araneus ventricosus]